MWAWKNKRLILFQFHPEKGSPIFQFLHFLPAQNEDIVNYLDYEILKYLTYQIRRSATHVHFEIHKMLNFLKHLFRGLKYLCRIWLTRPTTPYRSINPYGDKKAYISQSDFYGNMMKLLYDFAQLRAPNIYKRGISKPYWYVLSHLQTFHGVWLFIIKWNILKLVWSKICMFSNARHSNND